jgi:quercetin dioxygenase-like cupin family protein
MSIPEIIDLVQAASHPVARAVFVKPHTRVLSIAFKQGMILDKHQTPNESYLLVVSGEVNYITSDEIMHLNQYEHVIIVPHLVHRVEALQDSVCLLIQHIE